MMAGAAELPPFALERWFAQYEFKVAHNLAASDMQSMTAEQLFALAPATDPTAFLCVYLGYTETDGKLALREQIARLYASIGTDHLLVYAGAEEAIFSFAHAVLRPGDHVVVQWPCYQSLAECPRSVGCNVTPWKLREDAATNRWTLDVDDLARAIQPGRTRAVVINSPHNPTGYVFTAEALQRVVELCRAHKILLWCDEVYRGLERAPFVAPPAVCDLYENGVSLGVMSKAFGLAGLRIGWVATKNSAVREALAQYKDYVSICNSAPSEQIAEAALAKSEALLARNNGIIAANLPLLRDFFARHTDVFTWSEPAAGCIAFVRLNGERSAEQFCRQLVEKTGVLLLPSVFFDPADDRHFRLGFGRIDLAAGLSKLEAFVRGAQ